jgi:hypothetical protein
VTAEEGVEGEGWCRVRCKRGSGGGGDELLGSRGAARASRVGRNVAQRSERQLGPEQNNVCRVSLLPRAWVVSWLCWTQSDPRSSRFETGAVAGVLQGTKLCLQSKPSQAPLPRPRAALVQVLQFSRGRSAASGASATRITDRGEAVAEVPAVGTRPPGLGTWGQVGDVGTGD